MILKLTASYCVESNGDAMLSLCLDRYCIMRGQLTLLDDSPLDGITDRMANDLFERIEEAVNEAELAVVIEPLTPSDGD